jgi:murein L,D-transpeptidase YcbB/YkuD
VLGDIKFMFPNKHDVYMHDTPERDLFARSFRGLSHGCMRVGDPRRLAEILLAEDKGWAKEKVAGMFAGGTQEVTLSTHIPVHVTYFTAMVDYEGTLRTFGDLYGLDARLGAALLGRKVRFETPRYDNEVMALQEERRRQARQRQPSGPATLADAISDIFSP